MTDTNKNNDAFTYRLTIGKYTAAHAMLVGPIFVATTTLKWRGVIRAIWNLILRRRIEVQVNCNDGSLTGAIILAIYDRLNQARATGDKPASPNDMTPPPKENP